MCLSLEVLAKAGEAVRGICRELSSDEVAPVVRELVAARQHVMLRTVLPCCTVTRSRFYSTCEAISLAWKPVAGPKGMERGPKQKCAVFRTAYQSRRHQCVQSASKDGFVMCDHDHEYRHDKHVETCGIRVTNLNLCT